MRPSRYRQFLMKESRSAISWCGIFFSKPSGMREMPLDRISSIWLRSRVAYFASGWRIVTEVEISLAKTPVSNSPSVVAIG